MVKLLWKGFQMQVPALLSPWKGTYLLYNTPTVEMGGTPEDGSSVWTQPLCCSLSPLGNLSILGNLETLGILDILGILSILETPSILGNGSILGILETLGILDILGILYFLGILDILGIRDMLDTLMPVHCLQKLTFQEILKPRIFLGHLLRETPLVQPCTCRCPTQGMGMTTDPPS
ncbi:hypothetical protein WISP_39385 [Willisornis vidua]|uniref:Uncharacterized protein n=1 Tax=Willisornis vidua TaxID=1566151 RepID=A0ABQ9DNK8_9PASS|nr:hypothetical protein WISP_39385 [Willisornis vidua]